MLNQEYTLGKVARFDGEDAAKAYNFEGAGEPVVPGGGNLGNPLASVM